jgi:hypothetical protein
LPAAAGGLMFTSTDFMPPEKLLTGASRVIFDMVIFDRSTQRDGNGSGAAQ